MSGWQKQQEKKSFGSRKNVRKVETQVREIQVSVGSGACSTSLRSTELSTEIYMRIYIKFYFAAFI